MPHSFTLIVLLRENELFQRGLCHTCGNSGGVGGPSVPCKKWKIQGGGGPEWNSLRGGGLDIFWNYTMLSGRLRNSLRFIMVLGFLGGFVGSTFKGILSGSEFCPHEIVPVTWNLKYLPPSPSSGVLVYRNKSIFLHWELKSLFVHNVQILRNYFWLFCPQAWLPCQPVNLFISSLFSQGN